MTISSQNQRHKFVNFNIGISLKINSEYCLQKGFLAARSTLAAIPNVQPSNRCQDQQLQNSCQQIGCKLIHC